MATSFSPAQLERFRREAKKLSRALSIRHSEALDRIAVQNGFTNWSLLSKHSGGAAIASAAAPKPSRPSGVHRYYLHGDVSEDDASQCFCARCDAFFPFDHLVPTSYHSDGKDGERFLSSLARWTNLPADERGRNYRPDGAQNVLAAPVHAAQVAQEAARAPFHRWLEHQRGRDDTIGDVAGDILRDKSFPIGASTWSEVADYFAGRSPHVIDAVRQAWREFEGGGRRERSFAEALAAELKLTVAEAQELTDAEAMELTSQSGEVRTGFEFDFTNYASPKVAAKLLRKRGSLRLTVDQWFFEDISDADFAD